MGTEIITNKGSVIIEGSVTPEYLDSLEMSRGLNSFRPFEIQRDILGQVVRHPKGLVYVARSGQEIIGYALFNYPNKYSRWIRHPRILELGAIEISHIWQRQGIAKRLIQESFDNQTLEEYIIISTEFHWHWDLKTSGLGIWEYQEMIKNLYGLVGFKRRHTDDPEILEHPANMLMVRIGKNVSKSNIDMFDELTYQNSILI